MVPNSVVLSAAVVPLKEPRKVSVHVKLDAGARPSEVERELCERLEVPTRERPQVSLDYIGEDETVMHIEVTPADNSRGGELADEVLDVLQLTASRS
jgi:hypothetical protein